MFSLLIYLCVMLVTSDVQGRPKTSHDNRFQQRCDTHGYTLLPTSSSCYKLHLEKKTFDEANSTCVSEGAYLVVINDESEADVIKGMDLPWAPWTWVGLKARNEIGDWKSLDGIRIENLYHEWIEHRKPDRTFLAKCAIITPYKKLGNFDCNVPRAFLCEQSPKAD